MKRKSSLNVTLLFVGGVGAVFGLPGCGSDEHRPVYRTREDCLADWKTPEQCQTISGGQYHGYYHGPYSTYRPSSSRSIAIEPVHRGGFGSSFFRSGG